MKRSSMGLLAIPLLAGCPSSNEKDGGAEGGTDAAGMCTAVSTGGPVMGTNVDCASDGGAAQPVDMAACHPEAAPPDDGGMMGPLYGPTMVGGDGDDDDCKFHIKWSSTPICRNANVTFTIELKFKADGKAAANAHPYAELVLPPSHAGPNTTIAMTETTPGTYTVGPYKFDQAGKWTVRFHFYPECEDGVDSPHGHGAFFVNVP